MRPRRSDSGGGFASGRVKQSSNFAAGDEYERNVAFARVSKPKEWKHCNNRLWIKWPFAVRFMSRFRNWSVVDIEHTRVRGQFLTQEEAKKWVDESSLN